MNQSVTISMKGLLTAAVALLILAVGIWVGGAGSPPAARAASAADDTPTGSTLTMTGRGTATGVPDRLSFTLSAAAKRRDLAAALDAASRAMREARRTLLERGVAEEDIATTGLDMHPVYDYPQDGPRVLTGYRVVQRARVQTDDLAGGGRAMAAVVGSDGSTVTVRGLRLSIGDPAALLARARDAAVAEARTKAEQYAEAAGVDLGSVLTIQEVRRSTPQPVAFDVSDSVERTAVQISPGQQDSAVTVRIVWSIG